MWWVREEGGRGEGSKVREKSKDGDEESFVVFRAGGNEQSAFTCVQEANFFPVFYSDVTQ